MKQTKIFRILSVALTLALLAVVVLAVPVLAQEYIEVTPSTNQVGERAYVYGSYFFTDRNIYIYLSSDRAFEGDQIDDEVDTYEAVRSAGTGATGTFDTYFTIPTEMNGSDDEDVGTGTYYVYVTYTTSDTIVAVDSFTIESTGEITLDIDEGVVGTEVEITGVWFGDDEDIIVDYDGDDIDIEDGDEDTDNDGEFQCTIIIPESTAGDHTITVTGDDSVIEASVDFTVEPEMTISPESGAVGSSVTVSGTGFGDRVEIFITFDGDDVDIASGDDETDRDGSFESTFAVPALTSGSYDVEVEDDDGNLGTAEFTTAAVTASISANSGVAGTQVTVGGIGFRGSQSITVTFDNTSVATTTSDASGNFNISFQVPDRGSGTYVVKVSDGSTTKEFNFEIMLSASITPATSTAAPGSVGTQITINGVGFTAGRTVNVTYDGNQVATAIVAADGTFITTFEAPASAGGPHTIVATDLTNTRQFTFHMEATPPSFAVPLLPEMGVEAEAQTYFDWEDLTDPSGVTYALQIATDEAFSAGSIVLEVEELTLSEYTLSEVQALVSTSEEVPYYWHVRAIDGAGNEGPWSGARTFYISSGMGSLSQGVIYTIIGVGGAILIILAFWLGRKTGYY